MPIWRMTSLSRSNMRRKVASSSAYPGTRSRISFLVRGRRASSRAATRLTSLSRRSIGVMLLSGGGYEVGRHHPGGTGGGEEQRVLGRGTAHGGDGDPVGEEQAGHVGHVHVDNIVV